MKRSEKRSPANKRLTMAKAIKNKGYYDICNNWNSLTTLHNHPGYVFRQRVEVLIFKDRNKIFLCPEKNFYRVPGGSIEKHVLDSDQVRNEAREEARVEICDIVYSGIDYIRIFGVPYTPASGRISWDGVHNMVYTANYAGDYDGPIKSSLKDQKMLKNGKFYEISEIFPRLKLEYRRVIQSKIERGELDVHLL